MSNIVEDQIRASLQGKIEAAQARSVKMTEAMLALQDAGFADQVPAEMLLALDGTFGHVAEQLARRLGDVRLAAIVGGVDLMEEDADADRL